MAVLLSIIIVLLTILVFASIINRIRQRQSAGSRNGGRTVLTTTEFPLGPGVVIHIDPAGAGRTPSLPLNFLGAVSRISFAAQGGQAVSEGTKECAVCLGEYKEGQSIRCLHKCSHSFHQACIDPWLVAQATCPLCRTALLSPIQTENLDTSGNAHGTNASTPSSATTTPHTPVPPALQ